MSLPGDDLVLLDGHIGALVAEEGRLVRLGLQGPDAVAHGERESIVIGEHLVVRGGIFGSQHSSVLGVQPCALDISLLLWVSHSAGQWVARVVLAS